MSTKLNVENKLDSVLFMAIRQQTFSAFLQCQIAIKRVNIFVKPKIITARLLIFNYEWQSAFSSILRNLVR